MLAKNLADRADLRGRNDDASIFQVGNNVARASTTTQVAQCVANRLRFARSLGAGRMGHLAVAAALAMNRSFAVAVFDLVDESDRNLNALLRQGGGNFLYRGGCMRRQIFANNIALI